jgi:hypothetical protein
MKKRLVPLIALLATFTALAAVPPAEKLLPQNIAAAIVVPDVPKMQSYYNSSPQGLMLQDPSMKAFKEKFVEKFKSDVLAPLEKELGINFGDYTDLAQGQLTIALFQPPSPAPNQPAPLLLLLDTKDHSLSLSNKLADLKKKWIDSGKTLRTDKIRGVDFSTVTVTADEVAAITKVLTPGAGNDKPVVDPKSKDADKVDVIVGQSDTLLIVGTSSSDIEKVLVRQSGGTMAGLDEDPDFQSLQNSTLRDSPAYIYVHLAPVLDQFLKGLPATLGDPRDSSAVSSESVVKAAGLRGLRAAGVAFKDSGNGRIVSVSLNTDASQPQGILKLIAADPKESQPPAFVPADAVKFSRYRLDMQKSWNTLEKTLHDVYPPSAGALDLIFKNAGKDKDPNYDLRKELIGNLGDDVVSYEKPLKTESAAELRMPPALTLISSPNPEKLIQAIKTLLSTLMPSEVKERDFLGRRISDMPGMPGQPGGGFSMAPNAGYVAFSTTPELIEEFIRTTDNPAKPLRDTPGLTEAAEKVGGMNTGMFGYNNETVAMREAWDYMRKNSADVGTILASNVGANPLASNVAQIREWFDFSLLPPFDSISKYLTFSVYAGVFKPEGFSMKLYFPDPPGLKK